MITGAITAKPQVFAAAVKWAAKFLDARPTVPVFAGLLLNADGGTLTITAMNENVSAVATIPVDGDGKGKAVVSGRLLNELVSTFPDKPVEISGLDTADTLSLAAGRWKGTLPTMSEDDYPAAPPAPETLGMVSGDALAHAVAQVAAATSEGDVAAQWRSVHLTFGANEMRIIGTDSYRAAGTTLEFNRYRPGDGDAALVLADQMVGVASGFAGPDDIEIGLSDSQLSLTSPSRSVVVRVVDGKQYNAEMIAKLIAQEQPEHATVAVKDLQVPMKRASLVREKDGPIAVRFAPGVITLAAESEELRRDGAEEVDVDYDGPEVAMSLNPKYFGVALASAPGDRVDIALSGSPGPGGRPLPIVLTIPGTPWRHVLMPIRK